MSAANPDNIVEALVLNAAFDAGGAIAIKELRTALPATGRQIWRAIYSQAELGNVKRHRDGEPVTLTAAARAAIAAGRANRPLVSVNPGPIA